MQISVSKLFQSPTRGQMKMSRRERESERERERERERKYDDLQMPDHSRKDEAFLLQISFD